MGFAKYTSSGSSSRFGLPSLVQDDPYDTGKVQQQIDNARLRLTDSGVDVDEDIDKRNWFEKATNLPQGQNWFFDALELLGRPGQAVMNTIDKGNDGDPLGAAWKGLSGQERVRGTKLAEKLGFDDKVGKFLVGTGIEILTDPITYIPGVQIAKAASMTGKGIKAAGRGIYEGAERLSPTFGRWSAEHIRPAAESAKDSLGYIFNRDYKIGQTLDGGTDDFLRNLTQQTENTRRYLNEESMKNVTAAAKAAAKAAGGLDAGADVGRVMEAPLKQYSEQFRMLDGSLVDSADKLKRAISDRQAALRTGALSADQVTQVRSEIDELKAAIDDPIRTEIARPPVTLPDDPRIAEAAQKLIDSNNTIRQYAADNGIGIQELEGYMKHVLSKAEREARAKGRASSVDRGARGTGNPNQNILNQRKLTGSAEEINEEIGRKFFEPNAFFATAIGQKQLIDYTQALQFRRQVLSNPKFAQKYEDGVIPGKNQEIIDTNNYKFIKEGEDVPGVDQLADSIGGKYLVTKQVKNALDRYQRLTTDDGIKSMLKAYDAVLANWKKLALLSPLYHVRNMGGAMFNNYVAGMNTPNLIKYTSSAFNDVVNAVKGNESAAFNEFRRQGLGSESLSSVEFLRSTNPETQIEQTIKRQTKTGKEKAISKLNLTQTSREVGDFFDQTNRFALYKWMRDKGATAEQAANKVREVQFDYSKLSPTEREYIARAIPFYRWMRNNIPFQLKQAITDPKKYTNVNKVRQNAQSSVGLNEENMPDYMLQNFAVPVSGSEDGTGQYLALNLPLADLTKLSNPGKVLLDAIASPLKLPAELSLNRSFFQNRPIQKYEGQEVDYDLPGKALDFSLNPYLSYLIENMGGQPARFASNALKDDGQEDQARKFGEATMGISSPFKPYDANRNEYFNLLEQLQELQDYMKYIEQQTGVPVRSIRDIQGSR